MATSDYNIERILKGDISPEDLRTIVKLAQKKLNVFEDGCAGPVTIEALHPKPTLPADQELRVIGGWLCDQGLSKVGQPVPIHHTWFGGDYATPSKMPAAIVWHTSATKPGTAVNMAKARVPKFGTDPDVRAGSWHASIETDGLVVQMVPFSVHAYHAGSNTAKKLPFGWANYTTIGIELISWDDKNFPEPQILSACKLARALVRQYNITRENASLFHADIDPTNRVDPGKEWIGTHAKRVLEYAFAP